MSTESVDRQGGSPFALKLRKLPLAAPFRWLAAGLRDFRRAPGIGLFYGSCFVLMGWLLEKAFENAPAWMLAMAAGFLLVGPALCLGLYQVSRTIEQGGRPALGRSLMAWDRHTGTLAIFGFSLLIIEMLWARSAMVVFAVSFNGRPVSYTHPLELVFDPANLGFVIAYLAVGAVFAGIIYAMSVIAIPMILDRGVDAITAALTSIRLVMTQPLVMVLWGIVVTVLIALALLPWFIGLFVIGPVIGHASWHAYRDAIPRQGG